MASKTALFVFGLLLVLLILVELHKSEAKAKGVRTGRGRRPSTRRTPNSRRKPVSKTTFHSAVPPGRTKTKPRPFNERFLVRAVVIYTLFNNPVYSGRYNPYNDASYIVIPKGRALKVSKEEYHVEKKDGTHCENGTLQLKPYNAKDVLNVTTKLSYSVSQYTAVVAGKVKAIPSMERTDQRQANVSVLSSAINDYVTNIEIRVSFNQSILANTTGNVDSMKDCTVFVYESQAYLVESSAFRNAASFILFLSAFLTNMFLN